MASSPLFGQRGQFLVRTEIVGRDVQRFQPARNSGGERLVYILKGLFGRVLKGLLSSVSKGLLAGFTDAIEDPAGLDLLPGFVAQERVFECDVYIGGIQPHGFGKLIAGSFVFSNFQQRVGEVISNGGAIR